MARGAAQTVACVALRSQWQLYGASLRQTGYRTRVTDDVEPGESRAHSAPSDVDHDAERGAHWLTPGRPWDGRRPVRPPTPRPARDFDDTPQPVRPWLQDSARAPAQPSGRPRPIPDAATAYGLDPVRPWTGRGGAERGGESAPAPSNPGTVLQDMAADGTGSPRTEPAMEPAIEPGTRPELVTGAVLRARRARPRPSASGPGSTIEAMTDSAAATAVTGTAASAELDFAAAADDEASRRGRWRRNRVPPPDPQKGPRHAAVVTRRPDPQAVSADQQPAPTAAESTSEADPVLPADSETAKIPAAEQQTVDAAPGQAEAMPEQIDAPLTPAPAPAASPDGRGKRALDWLTARAPEPTAKSDEEDSAKPHEEQTVQPEEPTAPPEEPTTSAEQSTASARNSEPVPMADEAPIDLVSADEFEPATATVAERQPAPGTDLPRRLAAAATADAAAGSMAPAGDEPDQPKRRLMASWFGRRRQRAEKTPQTHPPQTHPPQTDGGHAAGTEPAAAAQSPESSPDAEPDSAESSPPSISGSRPTPRSAAVPADALSEPAAGEPRPSPRPRPRPVKGADDADGEGADDGEGEGEKHTGAEHVAVAALGIAGASGATAEDTSIAQQSARSDFGGNHQPDISRFLTASESQPGDDKKQNDAANNDNADNGDADLKDDGKKGKRKGRRKVFGKSHSKLWRRLFRLLIVVAVVALGVVLLRVYVVQPYYIPSESMEPTLHGCANCNDDRILVDKLSYDASEGDIVVFARPKGDSSPEKVLIKRVIGLPGDVVQLKKGVVYINGLAIDEPYVNKKCGSAPTRPLNGKSRWSVPRGDVFVLGDNRCNSHDSRAFGPIPSASVSGRAFAIIWPVNRITKL